MTNQEAKQNLKEGIEELAKRIEKERCILCGTEEKKLNPLFIKETETKAATIELFLCHQCLYDLEDLKEAFELKNFNDIQKLRCDTERCGFVGDLLEDGTAVDDIADPPAKRTILHKMDEETFTCPACGDMLVPLDPNPKDEIYFREKTHDRYIWDYMPDHKVIYSYYLYPPEDENGSPEKWTLTIEDDPENDANQMIDYLTLKHFDTQKEALDNVQEYLVPPRRFSEIQYKNPIPWLLVIQGKEKNRYIKISHKYKSAEEASKEAENIADQEYRTTDIGWSIRPAEITPEDLPEDFL